MGRRDTRLDAVRCFMSILLVVAMRRELENAAPSGVHGVRRVGALHPQNVPHRETSCVSSWDVLSSSESSCDSSIFDIVYSKARKVCRIDQSFQPLSLHYFHASFSEEFLLVFSAKNSKPLAESARWILFLLLRSVLNVLLIAAETFLMLLFVIVQQALIADRR